MQDFITQASTVLEEDPSNADLFMLSEEPRIALFSALLLKTEEKLLQSLDFDTSRILSFDFLNLFASDLGFEDSPKIVHFAHFILLISQLNPDLVGVPRILQGFSALYLSNRLLGDSVKWPKVKKLKNFRGNSKKSTKFVSLNIFSKLKKMRNLQIEFQEKQGNGNPSLESNKYIK